MEITLSEEALVDGTSSPCYSEPYEGFFKEKGFNVERSAGGFCDLVDHVGKAIAIDYDSGLDALGFSLMPKVLVARSCYIERARGVAIVMDCTTWGEGRKRVSYTSLGDLEMQAVSEGWSKDQVNAVARQQIEELRKEGCVVWEGYELGVGSFGSLQSIVLDDDFKDAGKRVEDFEEFSRGALKECYGGLDQRKLKQLKKDLKGYGRKLDAAFRTSMRAAGNRKYQGEIIALPEERRAAREQEILRAPVREWCAEFNKGLDAAGISAANARLYDVVEKYCSENSLPIVQSARGVDMVADALWGMFEDAMR